MEKSKSLRLFSYDGDGSVWRLKGSEKKDLNKATQLWEEAKAKIGNIQSSHPTASVHSFSSFKKAKKHAKKHCQHWFYIVEFEISMSTVTKLFDGLYGSDGPPCTIKRVSELFHK